MKVVSKSLEETERAAADFLKQLAKNKHPNAFTGGLYGNLGAGKTTFVQSVAKTLGVAETVTSPTFVIMKSYRLSDIHWGKLIHIDAYRLTDGKELQKLGFPALTRDPKNLILIEWPEHVKEILPAGHLKINFSIIGATTREIIFLDDKN